MAVYEDAMFVKALKLLHCPAKDSTLQIMHLYEEVMDQKYGVGTKTLNLKLHNLSEEPSIMLDVARARGSRGTSPAVLGLSGKSSRSSTPPSEPVSIRTSPDRDDGDLALEIFEDDLFCTVCKDIRVTSDNRLLECNDCHSLYHQECHKPPIVSDANDPECVWSCGDCSKRNQEKTVLKSKPLEPVSKKHKLDSDSGGSESSSRKKDADFDRPSKKHRSDDKSEKSSHKKSEKSSHSSKSHSGSSKSSSSSSSSSRSEHKSSKSSSSSNLQFNKQPGSPNSKTPSCTANIIAADKRLQNMKKKAAAKMQEKRSNPK